MRTIELEWMAMYKFAPYSDTEMELNRVVTLSNPCVSVAQRTYVMARTYSKTHEYDIFLTLSSSIPTSTVRLGEKGYGIFYRA